MALIELIVGKVQQQTPDVRSLELRAVEGSELPAFEAGSHLDLHLGNGQIRQYSLCNGPDCRDHYLIGVKREAESRGGSRWMHETLIEGDLIRASLPKNNFPLAADAAHCVLLAGGIGITPILSMAQHLASEGRSFIVHYFVRSAEHVAFKDILQPFMAAKQVVLHEALTPQATEECLRKLLASRLSDTHLFMCGPGVFMDIACACAEQAAWPKNSVHLERFAAGGEAPSVEGGVFTVRLVRQDRRFVIPPNRTIASVLTDNGIGVALSCEQGVCGTCITDVLSGTPDHRDLYLTDDERSACNKICVCVSRSLSPVLELDM